MTMKANFKKPSRTGEARQGVAWPGMVFIFSGHTSGLFALYGLLAVGRVCGRLLENNRFAAFRGPLNAFLEGW
ncbi:MAG TPA: hypothetical protein PKC67_02515 [Kiritimatiellia bacterium]|nr:hypothetical protein [Kiritimatiellia bacterium]HMP33199.1 hypothetical protein [Kiritimatiellia bacterium]